MTAQRRTVGILDCAAPYVLDGGTSAMVSIQNGRFTQIPFKQMVDSSTGRTKVRM